MGGNGGALTAAVDEALGGQGGGDAASAAAYERFSEVAAFRRGVVFPTSALLVGNHAEGLLLGLHLADIESSIQYLEWAVPLATRADGALAASACVARSASRCSQWAVLPPTLDLPEHERDSVVPSFRNHFDTLAPMDAASQAIRRAMLFKDTAAWS